MNLKYFGEYMMGLTMEEISFYLRIRAKKTKFSKRSKKQLINKFYKIAGINTVGLHICKKCKEKITLMYRHDVKRFADVLFLGQETYWD